MYSCPGCGSQMTFDITGQQLKCGRCERTMSIEEADQKEARHAGSSFQVDLLTCPTCGAEIRSINAAAAAFCSYCGNSVMLEQREAEFDPPEYLIPFQITREACFEKYRNMLKKSLCADHRLKRDITAESFRGIYVPFHSYEGRVTGHTVLKGTMTSGDTTYYYDTKVSLNHRYRGILHDASREMPDTISERLSRTDPNLMVPFSPAYLSGFYADISDTAPETYLNYAKAEAVRNALKDTIADLDTGCSYSTGQAEKECLKLADAEPTGDILLPVWFMSMKSGNRVLYAVQNAVTGEMWADKPLDIPIFGIVTALLAVLLFFLFNLTLTLRPEMVMVLAMCLGVGAQVAVNSRRTRLQKRNTANQPPEAGEDDVRERLKTQKRLNTLSGLQKSFGWISSLGVIGALVLILLIASALAAIGDIRVYKIAAPALTIAMAVLTLSGRKKRGKLPFGSIAALLAMIAGTVILVLDPFHSDDVPVYIVVAAILAAVIWESVDLLNLHNRSCSNPMPQFETHQGGEDHA